MRRRAVLCALVFLASPTGARAAGNVTRGCVQHFDASADYFPDKATLEDARTFRVEYHKSYKLVTLTEASPGGPPERYVLVQCGAPAPTLAGPLAGAQIVTVPISSLFAFSTTHLALLDDLGRVDVLTGVSQLDDLWSPAVEARIKTGKVIEFAKVDLVIDAERVVAARPSLLLAGDTANATLSVIRSAGIPVVGDSEWREMTALGRAEWIKYMAVFLNEEKNAQTTYSAMKARYRAISTRMTSLPAGARPLVMTGRSTRGTFGIAGGRSYVAALIADAGGRYVWADNPDAGVGSVDFEAQLQRGANADIWINGGGWASLAEMVQDEPRYAAFKAYRDRQVWVYEKRQLPSGANDYWSRSVTRADVVLADLAKIFHPALMRDHAFEWYMPVPAR